MNAINFEEITLREEISHRGGGIEISLDSFGYEGEKMTAYQNYLGGGMLGRVTNDCTIVNWYKDEELSEIAEQLRKYFFELTNPPEDTWEYMSYEQNQKLPVSAY
jgi:hypothetical protein